MNAPGSGKATGCFLFDRYVSGGLFSPARRVSDPEIRFSASSQETLIAVEVLIGSMTP